MDLQIKHRPKTIKEFVGNEAIVKSIVEDFKTKSLKHTMLFSGEPGVGKTTLAYIIAKQLLKCGDHYIIEKNAADTRGIDDVRAIVETVANRPLVGKYKIYIIDEAHQLTSDAQNALLKPLENPRNKHVYWIFCTTNPTKIIKTIRSRCAEYNLGKLSSSEITKVLLPIVDAEKIELPDQVIKMIVKRADGTPREAVKLLGQLRNLKDKEDIIRVLKEFESEGDEFANMAKFIKRPWNEVGPKLKLLYEKKAAETIRIGLSNYYKVVLENATNNRDLQMSTGVLEVLMKPLESIPPEVDLTLRLFKVNQILKETNGG